MCGTGRWGLQANSADGCCMTGRDDSGRCSFCGCVQQEVGSLFARGEGGICAPCVELAVDALDREVERSLEPGDECVGLCNQILGDESSRDGTSGVASESARGLMAGLVEQQALICALLAEIEQKAGQAIPDGVRKPLMDLLAASRVLRAEARSWAGAEPPAPAGAGAPSWLRPCLERLGGTVDALRALRPALEGLVPGVRLKVIDEAVGVINEVNGLLATVAAYEATGKPRPVD
jgi:hypothetical protein